MKFILSLDGGGSRGVIVSSFLSKLDEFLFKETKKHLHDFFDMFVGTSVGGLMALFISSDSHNCSNMYSHKNICRIMNKSLWDVVLPVQNVPKYDGKNLKRILHKYLDNINLNELKKPTLIVTYNLTASKPDIFKSTKHNINIRTLAQMTASAPTYFPCVRNKDWYVDGGVCANNPAMVAYVEGMKTWNNGNFKILSVGTGYKPIYVDGEQAQDWGIEWLFNNLSDIIVNAPNQLIETQCSQLLNDKYLRINSELGSVSYTIDDTSASNYNECVKLGEKWFNDNKEKLIKFFNLI